MSARIWIRIASLLVVVVGVFAVPTTPASAAPACGDTITSDVTLDADLVNCDSTGLVIGADGVVLDLNGHTIDGDGIAGGDGIRVVGQKNVVIKSSVGGVIQHFDDGIALLNTSGVKIVGKEDAGRIFVQVNSNDGLDLDGATKTLIQHVVATTNGDSGGDDGMNLSGGSSKNTIENSFSGFNKDSGIEIETGSDGNKLIDSRFNQNGGTGADHGDGIHLDDAAKTTIKGGSALSNLRNGIRLDDESSRAKVQGVDVRGNVASGIHIVGDASNDTKEGHKIQDNTVYGNNGHGIFMQATNDNKIQSNNTEPNPPNLSLGNKLDGIHAAADTANNAIMSNITNYNADYGIQSLTNTNKIAKNQAFYNTDGGIKSEPGTPGSGNTTDGSCTSPLCS